MQSLDIISVNLWHILISLANLAIIYLIVKKFLFGPVRKLINDRQNAINSQYAAADNAEKEAAEHRSEWEKRLQGAETEADSIIRTATDTANYRAAQIVDEAAARAEGIRLRAENEALLTRKNAEDGIKREIVNVSAEIAEKMLEREINAEDHKTLIDSFIKDLESAE